jgi:ABC-type multidrug transport system ATPase subunit
MLTGLIDVSSGDARIFGRSVKHDIDDVHNIMGVCPQQNVLFDLLTVKEHLVFFARLKGVPSNQIDAVVRSVVQDVGLTEKVNSPSHTLSGGQKRKLCVAISFIGDPKVVFLDGK